MTHSRNFCADNRAIFARPSLLDGSSVSQIHSTRKNIFASTFPSRQNFFLAFDLSSLRLLCCRFIVSLISRRAGAAPRCGLLSLFVQRLWRGNESDVDLTPGSC